MAKFNVGDKIVLAPIYMDGIFRRSPNPYTILTVDLVNKTYTVVPPNNGYLEKYPIQYADSAYRLASPDEVEAYFKL